MITIELPWTSPPLTLNQRMHWGRHSKLTKEIRSTVALLARGRTITPPVTVSLVWTVTDKRRRDTDNPAPTTKACIDGCRDAGVFTDDHSGIVTHSGCRIEQGSRKGMRLEIREANQ